MNSKVLLMSVAALLVVLALAKAPTSATAEVAFQGGELPSNNVDAMRFRAGEDDDSDDDSSSSDDDDDSSSDSDDSDSDSSSSSGSSKGGMPSGTSVATKKSAGDDVPSDCIKDGQSTNGCVADAEVKQVAATAAAQRHAQYAAKDAIEKIHHATQDLHNEVAKETEEIKTGVKAAAEKKAHQAVEAEKAKAAGEAKKEEAAKKEEEEKKKAEESSEDEESSEESSAGDDAHKKLPHKVPTGPKQHKAEPKKEQHHEESKPKKPDQGIVQPPPTVVPPKKHVKSTREVILEAIKDKNAADAATQAKADRRAQNLKDSGMAKVDDLWRKVKEGNEVQQLDVISTHAKQPTL
eukprot:TRINITY_DN66191_c6_g1_i1.p1 TRINITY_DN66191_c6_g1~~TRINITY_DN66191_c6_g1_i1.p1  ORF type:complete len:365 (+),score=238.18 TRINITY_DN66191_c6_g1_i1:47-1096(+)